MAMKTGGVLYRVLQIGLVKEQKPSGRSLLRDRGLGFGNHGPRSVGLGTK